jgi:hypothetical protein
MHFKRWNPVVVDPQPLGHTLLAALSVHDNTLLSSRYLNTAAVCSTRSLGVQF